MSSETPASDLPNDVNDLLDEARIPFIMKGGAIAQALGGLMAIITGLQNISLVQWRGLFAVVPWVMMALGVVAISVAAKYVRGRAWTRTVAVAVSGVMALGMALFFMISLSSGIVNPLAFLAAAPPICALVFQAIALGPFGRLLAIRRRLRDEAGYDLDL